MEVSKLCDAERCHWDDINILIQSELTLAVGLGRVPYVCQL